MIEEKCRSWWDAKVAHEEQDKADEAVNRALRWLEIERNLDGIKTVLEVGGATGAFSIPLAQRGFEVTHLDISPAMIEAARRKAAGLTNIRFVKADASDLRNFGDRQFDLVLNMDGAVSFAGKNANRSVDESCRVAGKRLIITASHRPNLVAGWADMSLATTGSLLPAVTSMFERGWWDQDEFESNSLLTRGFTTDWLPPLQAFMRKELADRVAADGLTVLRAGAVGSLANILPPERLVGLQDKPSLWQEFIQLCDRFDRELMPDGPGSWQRAGLMVVGARR